MASPTRKKPKSEKDLAAVGVIRKAHGVRGEASVEPLTDSPARLSELKELVLVSPDRKSLQPVVVRSARFHGPRLLMEFEGIDSPEQLRAYHNWSLEIPEEQLRPLQPHEYFLHDLVGLEVFDQGGERLGAVSDAREGGGGVLLTITRPDGSSFEVPFAAAICTEIDTKRKRMVVDLPPGLAELDRLSAVEDEPLAVAAGLRIDLVTIFPRMFDPFLEEGVVARARNSGLLRIKVWDLREFTSDKHRSTDDEAYGGGGGMVMLAEPIFRGVEAIRAEEKGEPWIVLMSPQGRRFGQAVAQELAHHHWLVFLCGRYEGVDERVRQALVSEEISVGDFVTSGGEVPAMLVVDAVARMVEGVVGDWNSVKSDSFYNGLLDHPHYTRPAELRGMPVPEVLLSGHAENIRRWRKEQALRATLSKRPDLLEKAELDDEARQMLARIREEVKRGSV